MSVNHTDALLIARRYATAIFEQAVAAQNESTLVGEFETLGAAISGSEELTRALTNPLISRGDKANVLAALVKTGTKDTQRAVAVIAESGRAEVLPAIAQELHRMLAAKRGELSATVTSARPLGDAVKKQLQHALATATGKPTEVAFAQDPDLLGGLVVELGSLRLDASLSGALSTIRAELTAPTNA